MDKNEVRHRAIIPVNYSLLADLFRFPEGTEVLLTFDTDTLGNKKFRQFNVVVEHPDLPMVGEGDAIPRVVPTYKAQRDDEGRITKIEFVDWN